jgi:hypothetical protein
MQSRRQVVHGKDGHHCPEFWTHDEEKVKRQNQEVKTSVLTTTIIITYSINAHSVVSYMLIS